MAKTITPTRTGNHVKGFNDGGVKVENVVVETSRELNRRGEEKESHQVENDQDFDDYDVDEETTFGFLETRKVEIRERVISLVLGNIFTVTILGLFYLNFVLFESYIMVFLYSFLASEALWDTKKSIVDFLERINDRGEVSPGYWAKYIFETLTQDKVVFVPLSVVGVVVLVSAPGLLPIVLSCTSALAICYAFDKHIFLLTRIHRLVVNDDTFVALLLIVLLLVVGLFLTSLFVFFTLQDFKYLIQWISHWFETNLFSSEWAQSMWQEISEKGQETAENYLVQFENAYVKNTTWEPLFRIGLQYLEESRQLNSSSVGTDQNCVASDLLFERECPGANVSDVDDSYFSMFSLPEWMTNQTKASEMLQMTMEVYQTADVSTISDRLQGVFIRASDGFWTGAIFGFSFLFLVVDVVVRVGFFFVVTFMLLSSKENLLHDLISGFVPKTAPSPTATAFDDNPSVLSFGGTSSSPHNSARSVNQEPKDDPGEGVDDVPLLDEPQAFGFEEQIRATIEGVLTLPVKMSLYHACATLLLYKMFGLDFMYIAATMSIFLTVFPILYAAWVCVPWCLLYALRGETFFALFLLAMHYGVYNQLDAWALGTFQKNVQKRRHAGTRASDPSRNEFLTGVSVFFGVTAFGSDGVLLGPLLVSLGVATYNFFQDLHHLETSPATTGSRISQPGTPVKPLGGLQRHESSGFSSVSKKKSHKRNVSELPSYTLEKTFSENTSENHVKGPDATSRPKSQSLDVTQDHAPEDAAYTQLQDNPPDKTNTRHRLRRSASTYLQPQQHQPQQHLSLFDKASQFLFPMENRSSNSNKISDRRHSGQRRNSLTNELLQQQLNLAQQRLELVNKLLESRENSNIGDDDLKIALKGILE